MNDIIKRKRSGSCFFFKRRGRSQIVNWQLYTKLYVLLLFSLVSRPRCVLLTMELLLPTSQHHFSRPDQRKREREAVSEGGAWILTHAQCLSNLPLPPNRQSMPPPQFLPSKSFHTAREPFKVQSTFVDFFDLTQN